MLIIYYLKDLWQLEEFQILMLIFSDIDRVFEHLQEIYGEKNVARITAFATLTAKACTRKSYVMF